MNSKYDYSVFYFTMSVYKCVGETDISKQQASPAFKLIFKSILLNTRYKNTIGTHITFTTKQIHELVKSMCYDNFSGFMQLGSDIAYPVESPNVTGDKDIRLIRHAIDSDGDIKGQVKIVVDDYETRAKMSKIIEEHEYPLTLVSSEEALDELIEIEKVLTKEHS